MVTLLPILIATDLPTPDGWMVWFTMPATGIEPGPARLVVQKNQTARDRMHSATLTDIRLTGCAFYRIKFEGVEQKPQNLAHNANSPLKADCK